MSALEQMTIKELVSRHNELVKEADQLASWKGRKDLLVEKVAEVMKESRKGRTIQAAAEELLKATAYVEDGKNIGHPYEYVLRHVLEEFPDCNTTIKCMRWYNTKLNANPDVIMPIRPRKKIVKATPAVNSTPTEEVKSVEEPEDYIGDVFTIAGA